MALVQETGLMRTKHIFGCSCSTNFVVGKQIALEPNMYKAASRLNSSREI